MARASTPTLLSLDRFAKVMGIAPAHFNGVNTGDVFPYGGRCNDVWYQYQWQGYDRVSREDLAVEIAQAEEEIALYLGYYPAPKWIASEVHRFPHFYRPEVIDRVLAPSFARRLTGSNYGQGMDVAGRPRAMRLEWGKFILAGQRTVSLIGSATTAAGTLVYSDEDGDGFSETATITLATTLTDECEIKVYFQGESEPEWEIRPARSITISAGTVTIKFYTWQLVDPELWEAFPTDAGIEPVDITSPPTNLVTQVDVYREYTDTTGTSAQFYWEPDISCSCCGGSGCPECQLSTQTGCIHVRDVDNGFIVPKPATYDSDAGQWDMTNFSQCVEPDLVKVWYYAGEQSNRYLRGATCEPLSEFWAKTIAYMTVARLERPFCSCQNLEALAMDLRTDLITSDRQVSRFVTQNIQDCPFGTRRGEFWAWLRVSKFAKKRARLAMVN